LRKAAACRIWPAWRVEIGDDVLPIGFARKVDEHFGPVNEPGRVCEEFVEIGVVPGDVRIFHRGGEIEAWNRSALAADNTGERGPDLVHAGLCRMTNRAMAGEHRLAGRGIAGGQRRRRVSSTAISTTPVLHNDGLIL
jgi:hypothetical protein